MDGHRFPCSQKFDIERFSAQPDYLPLRDSLLRRFGECWRGSGEHLRNCAALLRFVIAPSRANANGEVASRARREREGRGRALAWLAIRPAIQCPNAYTRARRRCPLSISDEWWQTTQFLSHSLLLHWAIIRKNTKIIKYFSILVRIL